MNTLVVSLIVFACVFGGAVFGLLLAPRLPPEHLSGDSKDVVKTGIGLIGTMTAILLGLLVASAKSFYDAQSNDSSTCILLSEACFRFPTPHWLARSSISANSVSHRSDEAARYGQYGQYGLSGPGPLRPSCPYCPLGPSRPLCPLAGLLSLLRHPGQPSANQR